MSSTTCDYCGLTDVADWNEHFKRVHSLVTMNSKLDAYRVCLQSLRVSIDQMLNGQPGEFTSFPEIIQLTASEYIRFTDGSVTYAGEKENGMRIEITMPREAEPFQQMNVSVTLVPHGVREYRGS